VTCYITLAILFKKIISGTVGKNPSIVHTLCSGQTFCWKIIKLLCYGSCEKVFDEVMIPVDYIFGFPFIIFSAGKEGLWDQKLISEGVVHEPKRIVPHYLLWKSYERKFN
jgi:hypothetical protein